jgi:PilZ domain
MGERRREDRNTCFLRAELTINTHEEPIQAEVLDISEHGLRLKLPDADIVPNEFVVSVPRRHIRELVNVRRRTKTTLGVIIKRFIPKVA